MTARQGDRGLRRQNFGGDGAIDDDGLDRKTFGAKVAAKVAGAVLAGEIKEPRRRIETRGDEPGEIAHVAAGRSDVSEAAAYASLRALRSPTAKTGRRAQIGAPGVAGDGVREHWRW